MRWAEAGAPPPPRPPPPPAKKASGCLKWSLLLMGGGFLMCCCLSLAAVESTDDPLEWKRIVSPEQKPNANEVNIGLAVVPDDLPAESARKYHWTQTKAAWGLGYGLSDEVHAQVYRDFAQLADDFAFKQGRGTNFTWVAPSECRNREWQCVFDSLAKDNADDVRPLTELFRKVQQDNNLNALQTTELVVSFVQNITYRLPTEETAAFGMLPPSIVVSDGSGDCDSKALLAVMLLRQLGVDAVVLLGSSLGHAALGVGLPVTGKKFALNGKKYVFVEVTTPGWALGALPPEYDVPKAWRVVPVDVPL
ncbi:MAG: transglutaminase domain-containing protein [Archangium sp.]